MHGPFVSDHDVDTVVRFLKKQSGPTYLEEVTSDIFDSESLSSADAGEGADGTLYAQAEPWNGASNLPISLVTEALLEDGQHVAHRTDSRNSRKFKNTYHKNQNQGDTPGQMAPFWG